MLVKMLIIKILIILPLASFASPKDLSEQLMELRSEIQKEADQLEAEKLRINASLQSLTVQKGELSSQKDLLEMKKNEMRKSLAAKKKAHNGEDPEAYKGQSKKIDQSLIALQEYYRDAIPFKVKERLQEIDKLNDKKENKELTIAEYFESYWSLLQRELRLSESIEVQKGFVEIDEDRFEVEYLKVGMLSLYFKTRTGEYGHFVYKESDGSWGPIWIKNSEHKKKLSEIFVARSQGITDGIYQIPLMVKGVSSAL